MYRCEVCDAPAISNCRCSLAEMVESQYPDPWADWKEEPRKLDIQSGKYVYEVVGDWEVDRHGNWVFASEEEPA